VVDMLVTIIIPSAGRRPELLQRAIKSALIADNNVQTEIIVVLNGKDGMVFDVDQSFQHSLVSYHKIAQGNVSKARNYGLSLAKGELIRFLDDDDYLYPDIASRQYIELHQSDADLSTYAGAIEDDTIRYQVIEPVDIEDYCAATLNANCPALTFATVYKSKIVKPLKWDEKIFVVEDEKWMRTIAASSEINWIKSNDVVAVWYQHDIDRLSVSASYAYPELFKNRYISIKETLQKLESKNRLTVSRKEKASRGLWSCIHGGFYFSPIYWTKIALYARRLDPESTPNDALFRKLPNWIHPLIVEWLMLPKRLLNHFFRVLKHKMGYSSFVRKF
jgi:glycosyltransferase involved in cell wall biosynthesis